MKTEQMLSLITFLLIKLNLSRIKMEYVSFWCLPAVRVLQLLSYVS